MECEQGLLPTTSVTADCANSESCSQDQGGFPRSPGHPSFGIDCAGALSKDHSSNGRPMIRYWSRRSGVRGRLAPSSTGGALPRPRVVLAVTAPESLVLMRGFPEFLVTCGWDVHVLVSNPPEDAFPSDSGVVVHAIDMRRAPSPAQDFRALLKWLRTLWVLNPNLVVAGTPKAGLLGMVAAWMLRTPARIYWLRGLRLETEHGLRARLYWVLEWCAAHAAKSVMAVSHSLRNEFVRRRLGSAESVFVVGSGSSNGVDTSVEVDCAAARRIKAQCRQANELVVGFVGRISTDKGVDTLLEAVRYANQLEHTVTVMFVGPEEPDGVLDVAIERSGVNPCHVVRYGPVADTKPYYAAMDVLCLPTKREGFPNVVLEAAVQRVPSVVTTATGAIDSVVAGVTGFHFGPDDSVGLVACLKQLEDAGLRRRLGEAAQGRARSEFARHVVWERTEAAFSSHVARCNGGVRSEHGESDWGPA